MKVEIVPATRRHFYTLTVLTKKFFPYTNFSFSEVMRRINNRKVQYLVAELGGATVGFADYEIMPASPESPCRCKLMGLAVIEEHRGKGIARLLLDRVLQEAQVERCEKVFLLVSEDNTSAISLYNSLGFVSKGKTDKKIGENHIILMEKATHK